MLALLGYLLVALIVATIAKALVPGRDPGVGITLLLGAAAQIVAWFLLRSFGWDRYGQPWSFFLSIAVAAVLLFEYRETGLDDVLARRKSQVTAAENEKQADPNREKKPSLWARLAYAPVWAAIGGLMMGVTGFLIGFFGPMRFQPWANQGPMLGLFVTGPGGVLLGGVLGGALKIARPGWPLRWGLWVLNAATIAYGLFVLDLVADPRWWR